MIREIINFTNELLVDIPDIMQWNAQPDKGLHVFIDIDASGKWINQNLQRGVDYDYYDGKDQDLKLWTDCFRYQEATGYITMNKVSKFDKKKKIHSCSPFAVAFNFNFSDKEKSELKLKPTKDEIESNNVLIREKRRIVIEERLQDYKENSLKNYGIDLINENGRDLFSNQPFVYSKQVLGFFINFHTIFDGIESIAEYSTLTSKDYVHVYLRTVPIDVQEKLHDEYVKKEIFSGDVMLNDQYGSIGFLTTYGQKKPFLKHQTSFLQKGIGQRFSKEDAITLYLFEKLASRKTKCLPNPLPIVIDRKEWNQRIIKIFNENNDVFSFRELFKQLFAKYNLRYLPNYYLLNWMYTKSGFDINDFDFVPMFRYYLDNNVVVLNIFESKVFQNSNLSLEQDIRLKNIFDFERIVVKVIFNNSLVTVKDDKYVTRYFGEIDSNKTAGGTLMFDLIIKYREAVYAFIYKSDLNAINNKMFDDMMYQSILSNIKTDEIKNDNRFEWNNSIKRKLNIWFNLYDMFNQNNKKNMGSKISILKEVISQVAKGDTDLSSPEAFAFGAGQLVSYLMDRSMSSNKTYAMLEPYLQKGKSGLLQDAIAQTVTIYKHDINVYRKKSKFDYLASQVLTYGENVDMKPLLKIFLAGCFSPCVIYEKSIETSNNI